MANFNISVELSGVLSVRQIIDRSLFPLVNQAVNGIAQETVAKWIEAIQRARLWSGEKDAYAKTVTYRMTSDLTAVVESDYKYASDIEEGRPPRDLKKMLNTSMKVRQAKDGSRYLIIPFRHNTPGNTAHAPAMSQNVFAQAKMLGLSKIVGHGRRVSGTGAFSLKTQSPATVRQRKYSWGDRLMGETVPRNQQGMVRMNTATGEGRKSSAYLTFRVMSEKSNGWIIPAQPGQYIVRTVVTAMQPLAEHVIQEAFKRSL